MASRDTLILASDLIIVLSNLRDAVTGDLVEGATVTGRVLDDNGSPVASIPDPITFSEISGSSGLYHGDIPKEAGYVNGDDVDVKVTAVKTGVTRVFTTFGTVVEKP